MLMLMVRFLYKEKLPLTGQFVNCNWHVLCKGIKKFFIHFLYIKNNSKLQNFCKALTASGLPVQGKGSGEVGVKLLLLAELFSKTSHYKHYVTHSEKNIILAILSNPSNKKEASVCRWLIKLFKDEGWDVEVGLERWGLRRGGVFDHQFNNSFKLKLIK